MNQCEKAEELKKKVLKAIEEAAREGNTSWVMAYSKLVEDVERILEKCKELDTAIEVVESKFQKVTSAKDVENKEAAVDMLSSFNLSDAYLSDDRELSKIKSKPHRKKIIRELQRLGLNVVDGLGATVRTQSGELIGIPYASERKPNRWWLGLPNREYFAIILACEKENGDIINFILSNDFIKKYEEHFSQDSKGSFKFNLVYRGGRYLLSLKEINDVVIDSFKESFARIINN